MQLDRRHLMTVASLGVASIGVAAGAASAAEGEARRASPSRRGPARAGIADIRPDSGEDETQRLQAAIDRAAAEKAALVLPAGRYIVRGLVLRAGSQLRGTGAATVLQSLGGAAALSADGGGDITVEGLSVKGGFPLDGAWRGLVELRRVERLAIRDIAVEASPRNGIMLERCNGVVTGCRVTGAAKAGIFSLDAEGGVEISHNHLAGLGNNGILVWRSTAAEDGSVVALNRIERVAARDGGTGENGNAINVFRAGGVIVTSNRIADCAFSGVRANSASNVQIMANAISRVGEVAIFVEFAFEGAVVSGNLVDGAATGVSVTNFDHGGRLAVVQGNLVRNLAIHRGPSDPGGFGIAVEADAAVTGNTIEGAPTAGLQIGWGRFCRDVAATGNVIRKCAIGIAVTSDAQAGSVLIASNMVTGSGAGGSIRMTDHGRVVGAELGSAAAGAALDRRVRVVANVVG